MTITVDLAVPRRVLAVGAHADDVEFGCGATLAKWADAGAHVTVCVCTDGSKGSWDGEADLAALVARREDEQRAAAAQLGAAGVELLRFVDGELVDDLAARAAVCRVIREVRPDVVLGHDPWLPYRLHPDHARAGALTVAELALAGLPALLVPYPHAADDHQRANARALADAGAARVLDPSGFDGKQLADALDALGAEPDALLAMGRAARSLARPNAAAEIVRVARALVPRGDA